MSRPDDLDEETLAVAASISRTLRSTGRTASVAESLTSGSLATHLGAAEASSEWFRGGVIAYAKEVKFTVLDVEPGPVVTAVCAEQMARGVARLTGSDLAVAVTGVGGPDPEEGKPAGTVFIAMWSDAIQRVEEHHFDGEPVEILHSTTLHALRMLDSGAREQ